MGLEDAIDTEKRGDEDAIRQSSSYGYDEREDAVWELIDEYNKVFPEECRISFVDISTQMTKYSARYFTNWEDAIYFIRVADEIVDRHMSIDDGRVTNLEKVIANCMCNIYYRQRVRPDRRNSESEVVNWLIGVLGIGSPISSREDTRDEYHRVIEPWSETSEVDL